MLLKKNEKKTTTIVIALIGLGIILFGIFYLRQPADREKPLADQKSRVEHSLGEQNKDSSQLPSEKETAEGEIIVLPTIDYKDLEKDDELKDLMGTRKHKLGLDKSLDMIVNSDEIFTIGDVEISMSEILKQAFIKEGEVFEEKIEKSGAIRPQKIKQYGIYVVQPGDNIWNIHFNILKEYYDYKGVTVAPKADEPIDSGLSSGVGKILKFSETMVIIYNLIEKKVALNIDLLEPLSKIVVYNMSEVFSLLQEINYQNIDRIQFDGKTIWIPSGN